MSSRSFVPPTIDDADDDAGLAVPTSNKEGPYSKALKALCAEGADGRKPKLPTKCRKKGCRGGKGWVQQLCYRKDLAGKWVVVVSANST